jgi:calcineurin-like phosphoesterase family protein
MKLKIVLGPHQRIFFTSDTHFGHHNLVRGISKWEPGTGQRDFETLEEMNDLMVERIDSLVGPEDILFHLGDWSFGGIENIWELRKRIRCETIHLVLGNHDHHIENNRVLPNVWRDHNEVLQDGPNPMRYGDWRDEMFGVEARSLFASVSDSLELEITIPAFDDQEKKTTKRFVLCHYPFASWKDMNQGVIHLHGHVHLTPELKLHAGKAQDVGVDGNDMNPYSLQEIARTMRHQPIARLVLPADHHEKTRQENEPKLEEGSPS